MAGLLTPPECPSQSPSHSVKVARPRGRASALWVLEAASGAATCDGQRFRDPKSIFLSPWRNRRTEITPFPHAAALGERAKEMTRETFMTRHMRIAHSHTGGGGGGGTGGAQGAVP